MFLPLTVMLQSAPHPFSHTPALLMCVLIAFTTASIPPAAPTFTLFSTVHFILLFCCFISAFTVIDYHVQECSTSNFTHTSIVNVSVDSLHYSLYPSCFSCLHSVLSCSFHFSLLCQCFYHCWLSCSRVHYIHFRTHISIINVSINSLHDSFNPSCFSYLYFVLCF